MGKTKSKRSTVPAEENLILPQYPIPSPLATIVDTHTHSLSTFSAYRSKYPDGKYETVFEFVRAMCAGKIAADGSETQGPRVEAVVDVWCEAPVMQEWRELADAALEGQGRGKWGGLEYWFVMGVHPHEANLYTDQVENDILEAMAHPRCVGWGEIGLDYHYDNSPRALQQEVFARQLRNAVRLGKPITIHTREAEADTERILRAEVPQGHRIHVHCFTDSPAFAGRLLDYFPNLHIGITGVITYATNADTSATVLQMARSLLSAPAAEQQQQHLRIVLETDAPYMVPANIYAALPQLKGRRLPLSHSGMIPWTAAFVAGVLDGDGDAGGQSAGDRWDAGRVLRAAREGARRVYGI